MRISEAAKMLNMTVDSIRFYEKEGILTPTRKGDGSYRDYTPWDIMALMRCARFRGLGFSVKETVNAMHRESLSYIQECLCKRKSALRLQIHYEEQLMKCLEEYYSKIKILPYNIGNYWVCTRTKMYYILDAKRCGNSYDMSQYNPLIQEWMKNMPFISEMEFVPMESLLKADSPDSDVWGFSIDEQTAIALDVPLDSSVQILEETLCVTTVIDAGELGTFSLNALKEIAALLISRGYKLKGIATSNLIVRNWEKHIYHRYFELTFPIEK